MSTSVAARAGAASAIRQVQATASQRTPPTTHPNPNDAMVINRLNVKIDSKRYFTQREGMECATVLGSQLERQATQVVLIFKHVIGNFFSTKSTKTFKSRHNRFNYGDFAQAGGQSQIVKLIAGVSL